MNQRPLVIKLGGAVLSSIDTLTLLFKTISNYQQQAKRSLIIVHGGGYLVDELMAKLQLETIKKRGYELPQKIKLAISQVRWREQQIKCYKAKR